MTHAEHYEGHAWIKVKRFTADPEADGETNYRALLEHHERETAFLIAEVRKLARALDELEKR